MFIFGLWEERKEGFKVVWLGLRVNKKKCVVNIIEDEMFNYFNWKFFVVVFFYIFKFLDDDFFG